MLTNVEVCALVAVVVAVATTYGCMHLCIMYASCVVYECIYPILFEYVCWQRELYQSFVSADSHPLLKAVKRFTLYARRA